MKLYSYKNSCNCSGVRVREARYMQKWSQEQLAAKLQICGLDTNQKAVSRVETGLRVVPDYELLYYAEVLQVSVLWLLGQEDEGQA